MVAGQAEYHATNGLFISGQSIILLCIDLKRHATNEVRTKQILYWLSAVNTAAEAQNQKLRVIICGTHIDECVESDSKDVNDWKAVKARDGSPFISKNDVLKLKGFERFTEIEKEWYRLNG